MTTDLIPGVRSSRVVCVPRFAAIAAWAAFGCGGGKDTTAPFSMPSITLRLSTSAVSIWQGESQTVNVAIDRTNFTGSVTLDVSGAGEGLTITPAASSITGDDVMLTVAAATTLAPGTYTITITGSSSATASHAISLPVTVTLPCVLHEPVGYSPPAPFVAPTGATCKASDAATLQNCVTRLQQGLTDKVELTALITCSGTNACLIDLVNIHRPVTVFGTAGSGAGFRRIDSYTYSIVNMFNASKVTLANLVFDEGRDSSCVDCAMTINIQGASDLLLERLTLLRSKSNAIAVNGARNLVIRNSWIESAGEFGIWSGINQSSNVLVENNSFTDVQSNAMFWSFTDSTTIRRNTFRHNHRVALFNACGGLCPGGQLDILVNNHFLIESNRILDGVIDLNNATGQVSGIEMDRELQNVTIRNNDIANNRAAGIGMNPGVSQPGKIVITGNNLFGNGVPFAGLENRPIEISSNCTQP